LPNPPDYAKVGGHWEVLASRTDHIKEGLVRFFCLVPYDVITLEVWNQVKMGCFIFQRNAFIYSHKIVKAMSHWMEAINQGNIEIVDLFKENLCHNIKVLVCLYLTCLLS